MGAPVKQRLTPKKRQAFLERLAECGNVLEAAKGVGSSRHTLYWHRREDPVFRAAWDQALAEAMDTVLEPEAVRRAVDGTLKPVYHLGKRVGTVREYSDTLLIFLLKGGKPAKYRERFEHTGAEGTPLLPPPAPMLDSAFFAELARIFHELGPLHANGTGAINGTDPYDAADTD
ncbi:MAG TPA: hypothetical protein VF077_12305 [Nitrospiraceae bacterium]